MALTKTQTTKLDIVCGRGRSFDQYPGNQIFRQLIKDHEDAYSAYRKWNNRAGITSLIGSIWEKLNEEGMRFIKKSGTGDWMPLEDAESKLKIGHALRDMAPVKQKQARRERKRSPKAPRIRRSNKSRSAAEVGVSTYSTVTDDESLSQAIEQEANNDPTSVEEVAFARRVSMDQPCHDMTNFNTIDYDLSSRHYNDENIDLFHPSMFANSILDMIENEAITITALNENAQVVDPMPSVDDPVTFSSLDADLAMIFLDNAFELSVDNDDVSAITYVGLLS